MEFNILKDLNSAGKEPDTKVRTPETEKISDAFYQAFQQGMVNLQIFLKTKKIKYFNEAAANFFQSIRINNSRYEPYFILAQLFYIIGNKDKSLKMIIIAEKLNPALEDIKKYKNFIYQKKTQANITGKAISVKMKELSPEQKSKYSSLKGDGPNFNKLQSINKPQTVIKATSFSDRIKKLT